MQSSFDKVVRPFPGEVTGFFFLGEDDLSFAMSRGSGKFSYSVWASFTGGESRVTGDERVLFPVDDGFVIREMSSESLDSHDYVAGGLAFRYNTGRLNPALLFRSSWERSRYNPQVEVAPPWVLDYPEPPSVTVSYLSDTGTSSFVTDRYISDGEEKYLNLSLDLGVAMENLWAGINVTALKKTLDLRSGRIVGYDSVTFDDESLIHEDTLSMGYGGRLIYDDSTNYFHFYFDFYPGYDVDRNYDQRRYYYYIGLAPDVDNSYTVYDLDYRENFSGNGGKGYRISSAYRRNIPLGRGMVLLVGMGLDYGVSKDEYSVTGAFTSDSRIAHSEGDGTNTNLQDNYYSVFDGSRIFDVYTLTRNLTVYLPMVVNVRLSEFKLTGGYLFRSHWNYDRRIRTLRSISPLTVITTNGAGGVTYSQINEVDSQMDIDDENIERSNTGSLVVGGSYSSGRGVLSIDFVYPENLFSISIGVRL